VHLAAEELAQAAGLVPELAAPLACGEFADRDCSEERCDKADDVASDDIR
jgi:hypothetical protein